MSLLLSTSEPRMRVKTYDVFGAFLTLRREDDTNRQHDVPFDQFFQLALQFFRGDVSGNTSSLRFLLDGHRLLLDFGEAFSFEISVSDFCQMVRYVLTNTDLTADDVRVGFIDSCRSLPRLENGNYLDEAIRKLQDAKLVPGFDTRFGNNSTRYQI